MATNTSDSKKSVAEQLSDALNRPDFVYTNEIIQILERLYKDLDIRRDLHKKAVEEVQQQPLRRVFQFDCHCDLRKFFYGWSNELTAMAGCVRVQISSDVKLEDAILGLKEIMEVFEIEGWEEWPGTDEPKEINTDHGRVIALPEPESEPNPEDDHGIPF